MSAAYVVTVGDVAKQLRSRPADYFDAVLCDPPYGISFMQRKWDYDVPSRKTWKAILRVMKPGAPLLACGGTRTFHRLVCAIEDGGFEIRDQIDWIYGSGFPKSLNIAKAIDRLNGDLRPVIGSQTLTGSAAVIGGARAPGDGTAPSRTIDVTGPGSAASAAWEGMGTALKPAHEPVCLARKLPEGTIAENALTHGVGGLNIDGTRIATDFAERGEAWKRSGHSAKPDAEKIAAPAGNGIDCHPGGRWPANVAFDEIAAALLDEQSVDAGGASRFFFCAKADRFERDFGCEELAWREVPEMVDRVEDSPGTDSPRAGAGRKTGARNHHPTLKPIAFTEWLATLILPPKRDGDPRRILVPFAGSGSEMIGAMRAGWDFIEGIEREGEYAEIARARLARWAQVPARLAVKDLARVAEAANQTSIFDFLASGAAK